MPPIGKACHEAVPPDCRAGRSPSLASSHFALSFFSFCIKHMALFLGPRFEAKGEGQILLLRGLARQGMCLCTNTPGQQAQSCRVPRGRRGHALAPGIPWNKSGPLEGCPELDGPCIHSSQETGMSTAPFSGHRDISNTGLFLYSLLLCGLMALRAEMVSETEALSTVRRPRKRVVAGSLVS